jgi:hypothetical protein
MGLFKRAKLRYKAERIAEEFSKLRQQQFDSTIKAIESKLGHQVAISERMLGGDADRALKGYQLCVSTAFLALRPNLLPGLESEEFGTKLTLAVVAPQDEKVLDYFKEFSECAPNPTEQLACVSFPVANYITSEEDTDAIAIVAQLLPIFSVNSQTVVASIFGDHEAVRELEGVMQTIRRELTGM